MIVVSRLHGPSGLWAYFGRSQPLAAWIHILLRPALGESAFNWQVFGLLSRWLAVTAMWWCFSGLWPHARRQVTFAALLFAVYPAFTLQAMAVTTYPYWLQYSLFFLSLGLMIRAEQSSQKYRVFTALALTASLAQFGMTEYFAGAEVVRPVVLWLALGRSISPDRRDASSAAFRLGRTVRRYLPYGLILLLYAGWQLLGNGWFEHLSQRPPVSLQTLLTVISSDLLTIFITRWGTALDFRLALDLSRFTAGALAAGAFVAAALAIGLPRIRFEDTEKTDGRGWIWQAFGLGALFTLAGALPAWIVGRQITGEVQSIPYSLAVLLGASLVTIAFLEWLSVSRLKKTILLSAIIGLLVVFHLQTGKLYRNLWAQQLDLYWQIHWRAPGIETPTALIFEEEPVDNQGMLAISAAVNLLYNQAEEPGQADYITYSLKPQYENLLPDLSTLDFSTTQSWLTFQAAPDDRLLIYYDRGLANCLWVVDAQDEGDPGLSNLISHLLTASNLDRIKPQMVSSPPPVEIFGPEPDGTWCGYFQKADLARQFGNWEEAAALADAATTQGFTPNSLATQATHEWLPFIEGYARSGRWEDARNLTLQAAEVRYRHYDVYLCTLWGEMDASTAAGDEKNAALQEVSGALSCQPQED